MGINPGTKYLSLAIFCDLELRDWYIKTFKGPWSNGKMAKIVAVIEEYIEDYDIKVLAIKRLRHSYSSPGLRSLAFSIREAVKEKEIKLFEYSLTELEKFFIPGKKRSKARMAERLAQLYHPLFQEFLQEQRNKTSYRIRLFEAVALAVMCQDRIEKNNQ